MLTCGVIKVENKGTIYRVSGPVVTVLNLDAKMNELVRVGQEGLFGEVIEIEDGINCPRYSSLVVRNVEIKESPDWLKNRLKTIGQTPINNVVDVTNYVLFETGQPFILRMDYLAHKPVSKAIFGMAIHRQDGLHLTGPNTSHAGLELPELTGKGSIVFHTKALPLLEGLYHVSVAVVNEDDSETFDYHDRLYPFRVVNQGQEHAERYGLVSFNGKWQLERSDHGR